MWKCLDFCPMTDHYNLVCLQSCALTGHVGRPCFEIPPEQLSSLVESGFTGQQMVAIIGVSLSTIRRWMTCFGLSVSSQYTDLSGTDLDQVVGNIKEQFPTCGCKQMHGHLQSFGIRVQQVRVRESINEIDPAGSIMHRLHAINRRTYVSSSSTMFFVAHGWKP